MSATMVIGNKNYSSWSLRAWLMARQTPLEFEELKLDLDTPDFYARIEALSPSLTVPALHIDGDIVCDSLAIGETLAERYPAAGLWPEDRMMRAYARSISAQMHSGFAALRTEMPMNSRATGRTISASEATLSDIELVKGIWRECRRRRTDSDGGLLGGFTIVDAMYIPVALRFNTYGVALGPDDRAYLDWVKAQPDVAAWMAAAQSEPQFLEDGEVG
ncbi:MAG: glutathione S-transferase family protein [Gammaproteobacteria bacterium]